MFAVEGTTLKHRREVQHISNMLNESDVANVAIIDKVKLLEGQLMEASKERLDS